jgi:hypothetical protein
MRIRAGDDIENGRRLPVDAAARPRRTRDTMKDRA